MRARTERPLRRFLAGLAVLTCIGSLAGCDPGAARTCRLRHDESND